jgi:hypothetical protein
MVGGENLQGIVILVAGAIGGVLGYRNSPEARWGAACAGAVMLVFVGLNAIALVTPRAYLRQHRMRGESYTARQAPVAGTIAVGVLYLIFRGILVAEGLWATVVIAGMLIGLAASTRLLNTIVPDD